MVDSMELESVNPHGKPQFDHSAVAELLRSSHLRASSAPINFPDTNGRFPQVLQLRSIWPRMPTVVPDANVLFRDIGRSAKENQRTVLVNAANTGAIRMLCPQFIVDEVYEHAEKMALRYETTRACYIDRFELEYLPLIRIVADLPPGLWTPKEEERLDVLRTKDPDDMPAVRLALATGSIYLSTDKDALKAAYGAYDKDQHEKWRQILMAGGDAAELSQFIDAVWMLSYVAGRGEREQFVDSPSQPREDLRSLHLLR
jgi:predicted nucleic acid-binding protein